MASPAKKTRSSCLLWLLVVLVVLIIVCSAGLAFVFLKPSEPSPAANGTSLPLVLSHPVLPTRTPSTTTTPTDPTTGKPETHPTTSAATTTTQEATTTVEALVTTVGPAVTSTDGTTTSTSTTTTTTTEPPTTTEEATTTSTSTTTTTTQAIPTTTELPKELLASCAAVQAAPITCARTRADVAAADSDWYEPLLYKLNISVAQPQIGQRHTELKAGAQVFFRMVKGGNQISLNAAQALRGVDELSVVDCESGKTLCVSKAVSEGEVFSLLLSEEVAAGTVLRLDFPRFSVVSRPGPDDIMYSKVPTRSRRVTPIMVGSKLKPGFARKLFPSFDIPQKKSRFSLCVAHWPQAEVRSNAPISTTSEQETCFTPSQPLSPDQFAFTVFQKADKMKINATDVEEQPVPTVELVFSTGNYKAEKHDWIYSEASKAISKASSWFGYPLPLKELHIVSAPIQHSQSALGLITLREFFFEYPTYLEAHTSLTRAILSQWIGGIVAVDQCFQEALTTYLEWKLNEDLSFVNRSRVHEVSLRRPMDLSKDDVRGSRSIRALQTETCAERDVAIFYTLDETYGQETVTNMVKEALKRFAFSSASLDDWKASLETATGSPQAGTMLFEWFSRRSHPILQATLRSQQVEIKQLTSKPWSLSVELAGSKGKQLVDLNEEQQSVPFSSDDYVVVDPERKSTAFVVYDVDGYSRLKRCWDSRSCPASHDSLKSIFRDFGAVLLSNVLPPMEQKDKARWNDFLQFARRHVEGDAECCVAYAIRQPSASPECTWVLKDVCPRLRFGTI